VSALGALLVRDMRIAVRVGGGALIGVLFFLVVVILVPFALGPDLALLKRIGPAILWLAALLANLLALDRLFAADHEDGSLDLLLMSQAPLELVVAVKGLAHWLTTGLPLIIAAPGRHSGPDLHRPDRRLHCGGVASRRAPARGTRLAADRAGPDIRGGGRECGVDRTGDLRNAVQDSVRALAGEPGGRTIRRGRRVASGD